MAPVQLTPLASFVVRSLTSGPRPVTWVTMSRIHRMVGDPSSGPGDAVILELVATGHLTLDEGDDAKRAFVHEEPVNPDLPQLMTSIGQIAREAEQVAGTLDARPASSAPPGQQPAPATVTDWVAEHGARATMLAQTAWHYGWSDLAQQLALSVGQLYLAVNQPRIAQDAVRLSITAARQRHSIQLSHLHRLHADALAARADYSGAEQVATTAVVAALEAADRVTLAVAYETRARIRARTGDLVQAAHDLQRAVAAHTGDHEPDAEVLQALLEHALSELEDAAGIVSAGKEGLDPLLRKDSAVVLSLVAAALRSGADAGSARMARVLTTLTTLLPDAESGDVVAMVASHAHTAGHRDIAVSYYEQARAHYLAIGQKRKAAEIDTQLALLTGDER
jgi:hypothetical protein